MWSGSEMDSRSSGDRTGWVLSGVAGDNAARGLAVWVSRWYMFCEADGVGLRVH